MVFDAEREVAVGQHLAAAVADVARGELVRHARPDVVVADEHPAARAITLHQVFDRGTQLLPWRLADCEHAGRALAAFVQRRVHIRNLARDVAQHALAHLAGVHADDRIDRTRAHQLAGDAADVHRLVGAVDHAQLQTTIEQATGGVDLGLRELGAGDRRWSPDARRAVDRHQQANHEIVAIVDRIAPRRAHADARRAWRDLGGGRIAARRLLLHGDQPLLRLRQPSCCKPRARVAFRGKRLLQ